VPGSGAGTGTTDPWLTVLPRTDELVARAARSTAPAIFIVMFAMPAPVPKTLESVPVNPLRFASRAVLNSEVANAVTWDIFTRSRVPLKRFVPDPFGSVLYAKLRGPPETSQFRVLVDVSVSGPPLRKKVPREVRAPDPAAAPERQGPTKKQEPTIESCRLLPPVPAPVPVNVMLPEPVPSRPIEVWALATAPAWTA